MSYTFSKRFSFTTILRTGPIMGCTSTSSARPKTLRLLADDQVEDEAAEPPRWVEIRALRPEDFQLHGDIVLGLCGQS